MKINFAGLVALIYIMPLAAHAQSNENEVVYVATHSCTKIDGNKLVEFSYTPEGNSSQNAVYGEGINATTLPRHLNCIKTISMEDREKLYTTLNCSTNWQDIKVQEDPSDVFNRTTYRVKTTVAVMAVGSLDGKREFEKAKVKYAEHYIEKHPEAGRQAKMFTKNRKELVEMACETTESPKVKK